MNQAEMASSGLLRNLLRARAIATSTSGMLWSKKRLPVTIRAMSRCLIRAVYWSRVTTFEAAVRVLGSSHIVYPVSDFRGCFELDIRSHVARQILLGSFEKAIAPILEATLGPGDDFVDVGANMGLYTVLGGTIVGDGGRVLAIEPAPTVLPLLRSNIARNALDHVTLFEGVATSQRGPCTLNSIVGNEEYSSLAPITHPSAPRQSCRQFQVAGETLDYLIATHNLNPALIKIDTEGAEGAVLRGSAEVLRSHRPVILSELDHRLLGPIGDTPDSIRDLLMRARYSILDATTGIELPKAAPLGEYVGEVVAIPSERYR